MAAGLRPSLRRLAGPIAGAVAAVLAAVLANAPAPAQLPALVIASASPISPGDALGYYCSGANACTSPAAATTRDPLVRAAARSLHYDIDQIYEQVRDHVEYLPQYGLLKGARGIVLDGYGTDFDQAQFMVEALREADAVAGRGYNASYVLGQITLDGTAFWMWTGIADAGVARTMLADGGVPSIVTGSGSSFTVTMAHVWVRATIGGTAYVFDPSLKTHTRTAGLSWQGATGYSQSSLLGAGGGVVNPTTIRSFNAGAFRQTLDGYRGNLESFIATNALGKRAEAVFGAADIVAHDTSEDRRTALPYAVATDRSWSGQIPDIFRTAFTVALNGSAYGTFYADTVGESVIGFTFALSGGSFVTGGFYTPAVANGSFDDCDAYSNSQPTLIATVTIAINHPYAANGGGYADRTITRQTQNQRCNNGYFFVSNDWGYTGSGAAQRMAPVASELSANPNGSAAFVFAPTLTSVAGQVSAFFNLASYARGTVFTLHDLIGIHTLDFVSLNLDPPNTYTQQMMLSMDFEGAASAIPPSGTTDAASAFTAGLALAYAEGAVPRQETDAVYDMAALTLFTQQDARADASGTYSTYLATPATWSSVRGQLSAYPSGASAAANGYVGEGYSLLVPQYGQLRQPPISVPIQMSSTSNRIARLWEGNSTLGDGGELNRATFLAWHPGAGSVPDKIAFVIYDRHRGSVIKAGVGVAIGPSLTDVRRPEQPKPVSKDAIRAGLSVNGRTGTIGYAPPPDLVEGPGEFPRSLSLQRMYDGSDLTNYGFGIGWKSNWYQAATLSNDGMAALGQREAAAVASALVAIQAIGDLGATQDARHLYGAAQVAAWLTDQTINNAITIARGFEPSQTFYRQASGSYASGNPDGATLTVSGSPTVGIINRRLYLGYSISYRDAAGATRTYPTLGTPLDLSSPGNASLFARRTLFLSAWQFPNGITVNADYGSLPETPDVTGLLRVYNNLGRLIKRQSFDYGSFTGDFSCPTPGGVVVQSDPRPGLARYTGTSGAQVSYAMDALAGQILGEDPDNAHCPAGSHTPPIIHTTLISKLLAFNDAASTTATPESWALGYDQTLGLYGRVDQLDRVSKPGNPAPAITIVYGADREAQSLTDLNNHAWTYYSSPFRAEATSPLQTYFGGTVTYFDRFGQAIRTVDPLGRATRTTYDDRGRAIGVTRPEGDATLTGYDVRGNVVLTTRRSKPGSDLADTVVKTEYVDGATIVACTDPVRCNKVKDIVDARGDRTDYDWDQTTGEPIRMDSGMATDDTACALPGGTCPRTVWAYTSFTGIGGVDGSASGSVSLVTAKTERTIPGSSRTTSYGYNTANGLVPRERVVDSGGLALRTCFAYDIAGNLTGLTAPNAGASSCP